MNGYICMLVLVLQQAFYTTGENATESFLKKTGGFMFTMPNILVSKKNETVCLSIHGGSVPAKAIIDIKWKEKHFPTIRNLETDHSCFDLHVPALDAKEPQFVSVRVQIQLDGIVQSAHNQDPIVVYPNKMTKTFIDTDRGVYKHGDKVKIRVLVTDEKLLPQNSKIPKIIIKNPLDVTVAVWENVIPENGLVSLEFQMVAESILGKWKIEALGEEKTFEVYKYVLPRYKINLLYPKMIYYKIKSLKIDVCGHYSYGSSVKGFAFIKLTDSHNNMEPVQQLKELKNGCAEFLITSDVLALSRIKEKFSMYDPKMYMHITATITEHGTNRIEVTTGKTLIHLKAYSMKFANNPIFQPGLPYKGKLKLSNINVDLTDELIEICYNIAIKKSWNYLNNEQCSNFGVSEDRTVTFSLLPMKSNVIHINFNARSLNHTDVGDSFLAVRLFSHSNSYITLQQNPMEREDGDCRPPQQFKVTFTTDRLNENDNVTFYYVIKSASQIYKQRKIVKQVNKSVPNYLQDLEELVGSRHKFTKLGTTVDGFILKFRLDKRIISKYQILVYYVTSNEEVVAASKNIDVEPCMMKVKAKWSQNQMVPGATATLDIKTGAHSLCSISAVDKSTTFFASPRHSTNLGTLLKSVYEEREKPQSGRKTCIAATKKNNQVAASVSYEPNEDIPNSIWDLRRRKRHVYAFSEDFDAYDIFNKFGSIVITNLRIVTKPCYSGPLLKDTNQAQFLTDYENENEEQTVSVRSHFPETWLWELVPVSDLVQMKRHLPHTITSWVTNVLCVSEEEGVGIANETEIVSFQSFFVEVLTPPTVKRDEHFYLYIHISNYLNHKFPIRVTLRLSEGLVLVDPKEKLAQSYCISENNTITHIIQVKGTILGSVNVTVSAEVDDQFPDQCGPETIVSKRDIILKPILVEPEGYPMKISKSALLCASEPCTSCNVSWHLSIPNEIIPETGKAYISLNGDLLGQTVDNLDSLLDVPTGCGEQIIATMAPNLYILRYLNATNALKNSVKQKIIRNLKIGYQKILNYVHKDGSFSAFGYHDPAGSMFLTAFVLRTLQDARQFIYVDQRVIDKAVAWIFDHQLENGCFNTMLHVFQDMGGTSKENSTASLTAYVIINLMEAKIEVPKIVQTNAKYCIRSQHNPDKYTLALSCYALFRVNWLSEANRMLSKLLAIADQQQNMLWWRTKENISSATDTEITSYVLLSLLHQNTTENLARAQLVVRWLSSKFGPKGGFKSTQDTVVALDALTKYSRIIKLRNLNLKIHIRTINNKHILTIKSSDPILSKRISVDRLDYDKVTVDIHGSGCVLAQIVHSYYLKQLPKSEAFKLAVDVSPVSTIDRCSIASLSPCLAYTGPDAPSNMAVMEVSLPTGYEADRASLYRLVESETTSKVKKFEEEKNKVNLYFTKLDKQLICFTFNINENSLVEERKESFVKLYDYYRPEYEILQFYKLNYNCSNYIETKIPKITSKPMLLGTNITMSNIITTDVIKSNETATKNSTNMDIHVDEIVEPNVMKKNITAESCEINKETFINFENIDATLETTSNVLDQGLDMADILSEEKRIAKDLDKRDVSTEGDKGLLNPDFVDMDVDMEMPDGIEANVPVYNKPSISDLENLTSTTY